MDVRQHVRVFAQAASLLVMLLIVTTLVREAVILLVLGLVIGLAPVDVVVIVGTID